MVVPLPVVIDTDAGIDDVVALALAARSPELRIIGVTAIGALVVGAADSARATEMPVEATLTIEYGTTEPVQLKVDNGPIERFPVQTCAPVGCLVSVPLKEPLLGRLRTGTTLKITFAVPGKPALSIDVPLLGFGLAYDKAVK